MNRSRPDEILRAALQASGWHSLYKIAMTVTSLSSSSTPVIEWVVRRMKYIYPVPSAVVINPAPTQLELNEGSR